MLVLERPLGKGRLERLHSTAMGSTRRRRSAGTLLVGVISDTHGLLRPEALAALEGVDAIVHAGDIGSAGILDALRRIAPVVAVRGNNDRDAWAASLPEIAKTEIGGTRIWVVHDLSSLWAHLGRRGPSPATACGAHDHRLSARLGRRGPSPATACGDHAELGKDPALAGVAVVISGHSHSPRVERREGLLFLNPGSAGPRRFSLPIAVARLHLGPAGPRAEIVELAVTGPARRSPARRRSGLDGARGPGAVSVR
jgi:predicted phosphodiesterase